MVKIQMDFYEIYPSPITFLILIESDPVDLL